MDRFIIQGGNPLQGEVIPSGNKNAALPLLAACVLTDEPITLHNVPQIKDVLNMRALLESLGLEFEDLTGSRRLLFARSGLTAPASASLSVPERHHVRKK